jgi:O-antigen/teichoic acid export membrane protein
MPEKSILRRARDGVFWLTAAKLLGQLVSWAITLYVIRILSPDDYGLMAMAAVYIGFIGLFNEFGLSAAIVQRKDLGQDDLSHIYWSVLGVNLALYALCYLSAPLVAAFYDEPRVTDVIQVASLALIIRSIGLVSNNMLARELAFYRQSLASLISQVAGALATFQLATLGHGLWSLVYGNLIGESVGSLLVLLFFPWKPRLTFSPSRVRSFLQFGIRVTLARLFWYVSSNLDLLIAGKVLGKTQLGYYAIAVQFALLPLDKLVSTISQVAFPAFSRVQDQPELLKRYYLKIVAFVAFVTFPVCWGIFLVAESAVPLLLSEKWQEAVLPLQILSAVTSLRAIHLLNGPLETAVGKPEITIRKYAIITVVLAPSFYVGSSHGLEGLAYSWLVFPFAFVISTSMTLRSINLPLVEYFKELRHPVFGTLSMVLAVTLTQKVALAERTYVAQTIGTVSAGIAAYLLYYALFNRAMLTDAKRVLRR